MASDIKKFLRDLCSILGHDLQEKLNNNPQQWAITYDKACDRCGKEASGKVRYSELESRRFTVLDRMRIKVNEDFEAN